MVSWPSAPSMIRMMTTAARVRSSPRQTPSLRSLRPAETCAAGGASIGRRFVPAGPPAKTKSDEERGVRTRPSAHLGRFRPCELGRSRPVSVVSLSGQTRPDP